jgi:hypothetical protein
MFDAVRTVEDFRTLDEGEIMIGYMDGVAGLTGAADMTRSYWHGWRNGAVDAGLIEPDEAQLEIEADFASLARF